MTRDINSPPSDAQSIDSICDLLADDRRRIVVAVLSERDSSTALAALARDVAARETEADPEDVPAERVEEVAVTLHHLHLPKLDDHGAVSYDAVAKTVDVDRIEPLTPHVPAP